MYRLCGLILMLLLWPGVAAAQEDGQESGQTAQNPETTEQPADDESAQDSAEDEDTDDTFVPTQQISEDLSVSFPVDI